MLVDSHCHLNFKDYAPEELASVLDRAAQAGVGYLINIGAGDGIEGNIKALDLAQKYPQIFCTLGIHPHEASLMNDDLLAQLERWSQSLRVVALGEMGLDYHYEHADRRVQEQAFQSQLELAKKIHKPVVIHDRDAGDDTWQILKECGLQGDQIVIHCFTGSMDLAKKYLDLGCFLSFTGIVTFKKAQELKAVVSYVPVERMLVETDAPYLAPEPHRGKKNEPSFVALVAHEIAKLKGLSFQDVARITTLNAQRFFRLPLPSLETSIAYVIRDSLYLNITNRCTLACTFCPKFIDYEVKGYYLKLKKEPTVAQILEAVGDPSLYKEIVFCGYGEPTRRLDVLLEVAGYLKKNFSTIKLRLNTDGLGNLVHGRNIVPELQPFFDSLSISLNAHKAQTYAVLCPSKYGEQAYDEVKKFIAQAAQIIPHVVASVVGDPSVDVVQSEQIARSLGAHFRLRELDNVG